MFGLSGGGVIRCNFGFLIIQPGGFYLGSKRFHFVRMGMRWQLLIWKYRLIGIGFTRFSIEEAK